MEILDIDTVAGALESPINLLELVQEELNGIYKHVARLNEAETPEEVEEAKTLLALSVQKRFKYLETLTFTASDEVVEQYEELNSLLDDASRKDFDNEER